MVSSRAWFALAVAGVLGLYYVGHGLQSDNDTAWRMPGESQVVAQERAGRILEWQSLVSKGTGFTVSLYRTKVPGGWLILLSPSSSGRSDSGVTFLPDPEYKWDGNSLN